MKTFQWFMEQILTTQQAAVDAAKVRQSAITKRQHDRLVNKEREHVNRHLLQTANQEKRDKGL